MSHSCSTKNQKDKVKKKQFSPCSSIKKMDIKHKCIIIIDANLGIY
jgi:hypothetical protein